MIFLYAVFAVFFVYQILRVLLPLHRWHAVVNGAIVAGLGYVAFLATLPETVLMALAVAGGVTLLVAFASK